ncbi:hypothetical protein POX_a00868 [Penicillium oxalicum]|uniref:Uncharacterized protein n=1 Tax=Penicillium oxalicum (strain 114-2 / CGMCC 5302) TaxID=933388 RepID=S7ZTW1_PENO1|nr:hypothetical protein POX_a00868 [Penicillium oxalicum]EPS34155.1 hypothetical protein PDE_09119 [Penicillium oxalicum 114-2]KAI2794276.1 hypothetical protein POX_a00868 [Penicillium oxalicum]
MTDSHQTSTFAKLKAYPFTSDPEFANGLAIILNHPGTPASEEEITRDDDLVLKAKCFFFSRKENITPAIDFSAYKAWLSGESVESSPTQAEAGSSRQNKLDTEAADLNPDTSAPEPAYPNSFAHIVELITTGKPIPGIEQIPDTVLEGHDISSEKPRRRKPWEQDETTIPSADAVPSSTV